MMAEKENTSVSIKGSWYSGAKLQNEVNISDINTFHIQKKECLSLQRPLIKLDTKDTFAWMGDPETDRSIPVKED